MRRNGCADVSFGCSDILCGCFGCDVFKDDLEIGEFFAQRYKNFVDKDSFSVKYIDVSIRYFPMHQKRNPLFLHFFQSFDTVDQ